MKSIFKDYDILKISKNNTLIPVICLFILHHQTKKYALHDLVRFKGKAYILIKFQNIEGKQNEARVFIAKLLHDMKTIKK